MNNLTRNQSPKLVSIKTVARFFKGNWQMVTKTQEVAEISPSIVLFVPKDSETNTTSFLPYCAEKLDDEETRIIILKGLKPSHPRTTGSHSRPPPSHTWLLTPLKPSTSKSLRSFSLEHAPHPPPPCSTAWSNWASNSIPSTAAAIQESKGRAELSGSRPAAVDAP